MSGAPICTRRSQPFLRPSLTTVTLLLLLLLPQSLSLYWSLTFFAFYSAYYCRYSCNSSRRRQQSRSISVQYRSRQVCHWNSGAIFCGLFPHLGESPKNMAGSLALAKVSPLTTQDSLSSNRIVDVLWKYQAHDSQAKQLLLESCDIFTEKSHQIFLFRHS